MLDTITTGIESLYNNNINHKSPYGKVPENRPNFGKIPRGVRSVILFQDIFYNSKVEYNEFWNYALTLNGEKMI